MATVKQLISTKSDGTNYSVECTDNVLKALEIMAEADISAVMVTEMKKSLASSPSAIIRANVNSKGFLPKTHLSSDLMTEQMLTVTPETSMDQCMGLMKQYHIRHLPVLENDKMVGMVSMRDVVDVLISERESTIKGLENYILGSGFAT